MAELAWLIPTLPLAAWLIIALVGHKFPGSGDRLGIAAIGVSFLLSLGVFFDVVGGSTVSLNFLWAEFGDSAFYMGFQVDALTATMLVVVTLISLLVQVYSLGYMHGDRRYKRYYSILSLFSFSMLGLVLADNFLLLFVFWELVGLCSFLLIGHWFEEREVGHAAMKAFLTTRVGDIGMLIGLILLWVHTGSFEFSAVANAISAGNLAGIALGITAILIFLGAVGKSAQFPLHVWLPDAMAGPTAVSALIHAATMVAAGVYLVARAYVIFEPSAMALTSVAWVGGITAIFAASIALVQIDIKRVLAFSTISQLGFMMLALGVGGYTAAIFHLVTHAIFKALLFLASGSVIHGTNTQDMREMGGLRHKMPTTFWTWLVGAAALAGIPPLAGFWSKEEIMLDVFFHGHPALFWISVAAATMTAFYITRATILTFFGSPRNTERYNSAKESPGSMTIPLVILGALTVVIGFLNSGMSGYWFGNFVFFNQASEPLQSSFVMVIATIAWILGVGVAVVAYGYRIIPTEVLRERLRPIHNLLLERYYIDEFYNLVFVKGTVLLARVVGWFDRVVVDGIVNAIGLGASRAAGSTGEFDKDVVDGAVHGVATGVKAGGGLFRRIQSGYVQSYILVIFLTVVTGLLIIAIGGF